MKCHGKMRTRVIAHPLRRIDSGRLRGILGAARNLTQGRGDRATRPQASGRAAKDALIVALIERVNALTAEKAELVDRRSGSARPDRQELRAASAAAGSAPVGGAGTRKCGERARSASLSATVVGSSPRVRGTLGRPDHPSRRGRFIPARARNATSAIVSLPAAAVHPRACGERGWTRVHMIAKVGSSPRVRGTRATYRGLRVAQRRAVHPRACGERPFPRHRSSYGRGSSPRVRGTLP